MEIKGEVEGGCRPEELSTESRVYWIYFETGSRLNRLHTARFSRCGKLSVHRTQIELIQDKVVALIFPFRSHG
jgi:hypothetical protein